MTATPAKLDMGFEIDKIDETRTRISGKGPGIMGLGIGGVIFFAIVTILLAVVVTGLSPILGLIILIGLPAAFHLLRSRPYTFDITDAGIEKDGQLYAYDDIGQVFVYNKALGGEQASSTIVYSPTVTQGAAMALGNASAKAGARVLYQVGFMHGRKRVILAKNISEDTASSLFGFLTKDH